MMENINPEYINQIKIKLENIQINERIGKWLYLGKNKYNHFETPGGGWKDIDSYLFKYNDFECMFSISNNNQYFVFESPKRKCQIVNYNLLKNNEKIGEKILFYDNKVMGYGSNGKIKKEVVKKLLLKNGFNENLIISEYVENNDKLIEDFLDWAYIREKVKNEISENKEIYFPKKYEQHNDIWNDLKKFINQSYTKDQKTKNYIKKYNNLEVKVSFGQGSKAKITWFGFLKEDNEISNGYYPVFLFDYNINKLYLVFGISEKNKPINSWSYDILNGKKLFELKNTNVSKNYPNSILFKEYDINIENIEKYKAQITEDLNNIIKIYLNNKNKLTLKENTEDYKKMKKDNISKLLEKKKQIILYGPPGTGKTYNVKSIIENFVEDKKISDEQIKFITFHQSYAYEEFIEGIKPSTDEKGNIKYNIEDGIFKKISTKALYDILIINNEKEFEFEDLYEELLEKINNNEIYFETKNLQKLNVIGVSNNKNIHIKHGDSLSRHIVSKLRIKTLYDNINSLEELNNITNIRDWVIETIGGSNASAYYGVLVKLLEMKKQYNSGSEIKLENTEENYEIISKIVKNKISKNLKIDKNAKPYFLVIDEINRGNISKILGELITLLESDKRLGEENELIVELPYSKEKFGIPPNLYIIATMNTSDKSIANLDIALRRRFGFVEMLPKPEILKNRIINNINVTNLLENLNKRIEILLDKDHTIGHSYFMKTGDLKETLYNEIIPLLEEYFYGDYEKLRLVLGKDFFEEKKYENIFEEKIETETKYELKDLNDDELKIALEKITNDKK